MEDKKNIENLLKMTIEDLEGVEKYMKELSSFLPLAVCSVNPLGIVLITNSAFHNLTGFKETEIIGEKIENLFLDKKDFNNLLKLKNLKQGVILRKGTILLTKEKEKIPVSVAISTRVDENKVFLGYFVAISDISEFEKLKQELEKKVEERTKDLESSNKEVEQSRDALMNVLEDVEEAKVEAEDERDKTLAIFENFPEGILFFGKNDNLLYVNNIVGDFLGIDIKKGIGQSIESLKENFDLKPLVDIIGADIKQVDKEELELKNNLILEISSILIMRENRKIGILVILRDITREKIVERLKTEFVSISAHQLRTPLSAVKWTLKMILDGDIGEISKDQRDFLLKTYKSNERMIRLVNDLLNVTRIEEGRFIYNTKNQNIIKIAQEVFSSSLVLAKRKKLKLIFQKPKDKVPKIEIDPEKISIVFQNLLDNAIHYTKSEGMIKFSIKYLKNKKEIFVSVKDSGIGIPESQQKRVFQRFFRAVNAVKTETVGTGLGLFITKNIIEAHHGKIWFESVENKGTTFYFTIPVK
jgi:PAS domain S-box-containing protein